MLEIIIGPYIDKFFRKKSISCIQEIMGNSPSPLTVFCENILSDFVKQYNPSLHGDHPLSEIKNAFGFYNNGDGNFCKLLNEWRCEDDNENLTAKLKKHITDSGKNAKGECPRPIGYLSVRDLRNAVDRLSFLMIEDRMFNKREDQEEKRLKAEIKKIFQYIHLRISDNIDAKFKANNSRDKMCIKYC
jgi:hypothetical protein